jgi:hypothetical protein
VTRMSQLSGPITLTYTVPAATITAVPVWSLGMVPFNCVVTGVKLVPDDAVTANASHNFIFTLKNGSTAVASRTWAATNSVALTAEAMTLSATLANRNLSEGDTLSLDRSITGNGLASGRFSVVVTVQVR